MNNLEIIVWIGLAVIAYYLWMNRGDLPLITPGEGFIDTATGQVKSWFGGQ